MGYFVGGGSSLAFAFPRFELVLLQSSLEFSAFQVGLFQFADVVAQGDVESFYLVSEYYEFVFVLDDLPLQFVVLVAFAL
jgi:hypothetical protein